jgi:hypothetical protein
MNLSGIEKIKAILNWNNLFLFFIFLLLLPNQLIGLPGLDLDSSWQIATNLALRDGLAFGKEFIFTYGPLGFLSTHIGLEIPYGYLWIFLFDICIIGIILFILVRILRDYNSLIVYGIIFIAVYHLAYAETTYRILVIVLFFLLQNIKKFNFFSFTAVVLLLVIQFFIKPSAALYFSVIFIVTTFYIAIYKVNKWAWVYPFGLVLLIYLLSKLLKVELKAYLTTTIEISSAYSDTMNLIAFSKLKTVLFLLFAISFVLTFFIISILTIFKAKNLDTIFISGIVILDFYFLFKQSYVRFDGGHLLAFWSTVLSMVFIFLYHTNHLLQRFSRFLYLFIFIIFILAFGFLSKFIGGRYPFSLPIGYVSELFTPDFKNDYFKSAQEFTKLPDSIRNIIGNNSIDVIPADIASIFFNRLNYKPRPVIQSYVASSTSLNVLNSNHYKSPDASEFILYNNGSINNRYPFWDESLVKQVLISRYEPLDSLFAWKGNEKHDTSFLLIKRELPLKFIEKLITDTTLIFNKKYYIPKTDNLIYISAELEYSIWGKLQKILYQPPIIFIKLFYEDGATGTYRLIVPEMQHGVIINKKLLTQSDGYLLFKYQGSKNENITSFIIQPENSAFKTSFRIKLTEHAYML